MPLRVSRRKDTGTLWITGTVRPAGAAAGVRVRRRAGSDKPDLAREEAATLEAEILRTAWHGERPTTRSFSEAVVSYTKAEQRSAGTLALLHRLVLHFVNAPLHAINQEAVDKARDALLRPNAKPATVKRNIITPLRAVLTHAHERQWCDRPVFKLPRRRGSDGGRTGFLLPSQAEALVQAAAPHLRPLLTFLLCTGCRLNEALTLTWDQVDLQGARVLIWADQTKGELRRNVVLPPRAVAALASLPGERKDEVFRTRGGDAYRDTRDGKGGGQIKTAWATACAGARLPGEWEERARPDRKAVKRVFIPQHTPHELRHTWASWHYAVWGDLIRLKLDGTWSSASQVERYAHLMPEGHREAICSWWGIPVPGHASGTAAWPAVRKA